MNKRIVAAAAAAAALLAGPAFAQKVDATEVDPRRMTQQLEEPTNFDVAAQAGVGTFVGGGALSDDTGVGPVWGVKVAGPLARAFGWEIGYEGSRNPVVDDTGGDSTGLWRHGLSGMAKVYAPMSDENSFRPFAGAGIGGSYVNPGNAAEDQFQSDFVAEIPVGVGVEFASEGGFTAGLRGTYRFLMGQDIAEPSGDTGGGALLGGSLTVGGEF